MGRFHVLAAVPLFLRLALVVAMLVVCSGKIERAATTLLPDDVARALAQQKEPPSELSVELSLGIASTDPKRAMLRVSFDASPFIRRACGAVMYVNGEIVYATPKREKCEMDAASSIEVALEAPSEPKTVLVALFDSHGDAVAMAPSKIATRASFWSAAHIVAGARERFPHTIESNNSDTDNDAVGGAESVIVGNSDDNADGGMVQHSTNEIDPNAAADVWGRVPGATDRNSVDTNGDGTLNGDESDDDRHMRHPSEPPVVSIRWLRPIENAIECSPMLTVAFEVVTDDQGIDGTVTVFADDNTPGDLASETEIGEPETVRVAPHGSYVVYLHPWVVMGDIKRHIELKAILSAVTTSGVELTLESRHPIYTQRNHSCVAQFTVAQVTPSFHPPGNPCSDDVTFVTAVANIGWDTTYIRRGLEVLLASQCNVVAYVDADLEPKLRPFGGPHVEFRRPSLDDFEYKEAVQRLRTEEWKGRVWARPKLEQYLPLVLSKTRWLQSVADANPFNTEFFIWADSYDLCWFGPRHPRYAPDISRLRPYMKQGKAIAFTYDVGHDNFVHGMDRGYLSAAAGSNFTSNIVYGYMFGGTAAAVARMRRQHDDALFAALNVGHLGTEENALTIAAMRHPADFHLFDSSNNVFRKHLRCFPNDVLDMSSPQVRIVSPVEGQKVAQRLPLHVELEVKGFELEVTGIICVGIWEEDNEEEFLEVCTAGLSLDIVGVIADSGVYIMEAWAYSWAQVYSGVSRRVSITAG